MNSYRQQKVQIHRVFRSAALAGAALILFVAVPYSGAQESSPGSCAPSELSGQIAAQGQGVLVTPNNLKRTEGAATTEKAAISPAEMAERKHAFEAFAKDARKGSAAAQVNLAITYLSGYGTKVDPIAGLAWLRRASQQGEPRADFNLGTLYLTGCSVPRNYAEAFRYFTAAAEKGDAAAQASLGYMYDRGLGVAVDRTVAADWYKQAAMQGEPLAEYNLGDLYFRGEGVGQSDSEAFAWFQKAAAHNYSGAQIKLGFLYANGRGTTRNEELAYAWLTIASRNGDARGKKLQDALTGKMSAGQLESATKMQRELQSQITMPASQFAQAH